MREMDLSEQITYSTVLIKAVNKDNICYQTGTGFIMILCQNKETKNNVKVLITNKHVIDGSDSTELELCQEDDDGNPIDTKTIVFRFKSSLWISHPDPLVDLCCIPIDTICYNNQSVHSRCGGSCFVNFLSFDLIPSQEQLKTLFAFEEIIMIGYPTGLSDEYNHKPIVRRGITASHPLKDYRGKKEVLLDVAMFQGSSGSPVFIFNPCCFSTNNNRFNYGKRLYLLGVAYREFITPNEEPHDLLDKIRKHLLKIDTSFPMNLARMIKSEMILDFEKMLQDGRIKVDLDYSPPEPGTKE